MRIKLTVSSVPALGLFMMVFRLLDMNWHRHLLDDLDRVRMRDRDLNWHLDRVVYYLLHWDRDSLLHVVGHGLWYMNRHRSVDVNLDRVRNLLLNRVGNDLLDLDVHWYRPLNRNLNRVGDDLLYRDRNRLGDVHRVRLINMDRVGPVDRDLDRVRDLLLDVDGVGLRDGNLDGVWDGLDMVDRVGLGHVNWVRPVNMNLDWDVDVLDVVDRVGDLLGVDDGLDLLNVLVVFGVAVIVTSATVTADVTA